MNGQSGSYTGHNGTCTYCGRYQYVCSCMSEREIELIKGMYYFAGLYNATGVDMSWQDGSDGFVMNYLKNMKIKHCKQDLIRAGLIK